MSRNRSENPVVLSRIYTRTGDQGTTALADGSRTAKTDARLAAYADVEEANCAIGMALTFGNLSDEIARVLGRVQNELFDVGADLCNPVIPVSPAAEPPAYFGGTAWDGMRIIYKMIESQQGKAFDGTAAVKAVLGYKFDGTRGSETVQADDRNMTLNFYMRRAVKGPDGKLKLEVADTVRDIKGVP